jgi:D-amino-acid oxidase
MLCTFLIIRQFRNLTAEELPDGVDAGTEFTSVCINVALYLPYLAGECRKHGIVLERQILTHISEARKMHHSGWDADVLINCTGLMASTLGGVNDKTVVPARGQTVIVRNDPGDWGIGSGPDVGEEELVYYMKRASGMMLILVHQVVDPLLTYPGGGTVLGGSYQIGNWESQPDHNLAIRIMKRAVELNPELAGGKGIDGLSIVRHAVGLRPYRAQGVRLEKEKIDGAWVVHNYGHAGFGYQVSYACAERVVTLVDEIIGV